MPKPPTMKDVAAAAGVALKTVSRHVNGATNIDPALAARIATAITELGYRHNLAAASIRPGRSAKVIGLVISDLANPYWSLLARSVERTLSENGYLLMTVSSEEDADRHRLLVDRLLAQRVDGLIVSPPRRDTTAWAAAAAPLLPVVAIDRPALSTPPPPAPVQDARADPEAPATSPTEPDLASNASAEAKRRPHPPLVDTILADNAGGAEAATRELLRHGARRILFLGDSLELYTMRERHAGFLRALKSPAAGADSSVATAHTAAEAADVLAALLGTGRIDAVFAANNRASIGAIEAFTRAGTRLPLIGFDDFESAALVRPAVSVVAQDVALMGEAAARAVLARLAGATPAPATTTLPTSLILRGSERP
ncbi:LacI family DNA-binding transcriptional regulator [Herbiconiux sp. VKM Ac-1786]|uniref:LacI family DNA-binding transcriptional regulator n=1 Tax=Herbiconiux sp. VKM Ac-1786 TaxID=2783824 RepID=UPI00188D8138|nr:LacI family DNA-binding transcriptional regulator [Herbiconiux sp. VKM Ac-1786]MBF4573063.1 LacI family DNA-binding transcriptional regulator [Herbiconiux sp. VKM Ac-1786]